MSRPCTLLLVLCGAALPIGGCTAAKAQFQILSAEQGLHQAAEHDAETVAAFEYEMARLGLARAAAETPRLWLLRMRREGSSVLDASRLDAITDLVEALYRERYAVTT